MNSYDDEYKGCKTLFWGDRPAKYVQLFVEKKLLNLKGCRTLDIGAGEGKNAIYLAKNGANVHCVDISKTALDRLTGLPDYNTYKGRIKLSTEDARYFETNDVYDLIICYGLIHALNSREEALNLIEKLQTILKPSGYMIIATFNNLLPPPLVQEYLKMDAFLNPDELRTLFSEWKILEYEESIITETHHTSKIEHQHSISRLIAKKNA